MLRSVTSTTIDSCCAAVAARASYCAGRQQGRRFDVHEQTRCASVLGLERTSDGDCSTCLVQPGCHALSGGCSMWRCRARRPIPQPESISQRVDRIIAVRSRAGLPDEASLPRPAVPMRLAQKMLMKKSATSLPKSSNAPPIALIASVA